MVRFTATMHKFEKQGEKTGWTYIEVPADLAQKLKPGNRKELKVKGKLDDYKLQRASLIPMGGGIFILPVNAGMRKAIGKRAGAMVKLQLDADESPFVFNPDFIACLDDDPAAKSFFETLPGSHQRYFSKWIDSAKTDATKVKRISLTLNALSKKWGYGEMLRASQGKSI
jgi:hypothetical protein